jgi:hypothetical protein
MIFDSICLTNDKLTKHHKKLKGDEDKAESEKFLTVNFQRNIKEGCQKWLRPYENNADTGKKTFLSGFAVC